MFAALHRRGTVTEAMLYAFDLLELDGADLRALPLCERFGSLCSTFPASRSVSCPWCDRDSPATLLERAGPTPVAGDKGEQ